MRKLVLGIFAVVCVQFAFVVYTALQSPLDVAVGPIFSETITDWAASDPAGPPDIPVVDETEDEGTAPGFSRRSESPHPFQRERAEVFVRDRMSTVRTRPARSGEQFDNLRPATPGDFEAVVISYNRSPEVTDCDKIEAPQPKKRSYIAKAAPLVKKPWEWIKAVGSKLN